MTNIVVRKNGPCLVQGDDVTLVDADGKEIPIERRPFALCRCGASERKPFCDGSHNRIGFDGSLATGS